MPSGKPCHHPLRRNATRLYPLPSKHQEGLDRLRPRPKRPPTSGTLHRDDHDLGEPAAKGSSGPVEWSQRSQSAAATEHLGLLIGQALQGGEVLALFGELGTGKTVLVRGIAAGLEAPPCSVSSPTFVLVHEYRGKLPLIHADLYRLESPRELDQLGLSDYVDGHHVLAIEWADKAGPDLPEDRLEVQVGHQSKTVRTITMKATGTVSRSLLARVRKQDQAGRRSWPARDRKPQK